MQLRSIVGDKLRTKVCIILLCMLYVYNSIYTQFTMFTQSLALATGNVPSS